MIPLSYPIILIPTDLAKDTNNCDLDEYFLSNVTITARNLPGNASYVYTGLCNFQVVDKYMLNIEQGDGFTEEELLTDLQDDSVWIDPVESPNATNHPKENRYIENNVTNNYSLQSYNTYITQNVYQCNDTSNFIFDDCNYKRGSKADKNVADSEILNDLDLYEDDDFECGMFLSQLSEEILNEERSKEDRQVLSENSALKQLIATDKRPVKQRKTVLLVGDDSNNAHTVHSISLTDPNSKCLGDLGSEVVIDNDVNKNSNQKIYQCNRCKQIFDNIATFRQHIRAGHKQTSNYGLRSECDKLLTCKPNNKRKDLNVHFMCTQCNKSFKNQEKFERHINGHGDPDLECDICHKVYASTGSLKTHKKLHNRVYACEKCPKTYTTKQGLKVHFEKYHRNETSSDESEDDTSDINDYEPLAKKTKKTNDKKRNNDIIESNMFAKILSNRDSNDSTKSRSFSKGPCGICYKNFNRISDLKRHLIEHIVKSTMSKAPVNRDGTLHIECIVCNEAVFSKIDRYKAHLREHAKLTLYQCTLCDKSFSDSSNFSKHKKVHAAKCYQCDTCLKKFQTKKMLSKHMEYHSKNPPRNCKECGKVFYLSSFLKKHMKTHKSIGTSIHQCSFCGEGFVSWKTKLDHEWMVHKVRKAVIDCTVCGYKFRKFAELKKHCNLYHGIKISQANSLINNNNLEIEL